MADSGSNDDDEKVYTIKDRELLLEKIKTFTRFEYLPLLKIIKKNNIAFSENKNGIFVDISKLPNEVIAEIDELVTLCFENRKLQDERNMLYEDIKRQVGLLYENKLQKKQKEQDNNDDEREEGDDAEEEENEEEREVEDDGEEEVID